jgi:hypothetical protein
MMRLACEWWTTTARITVTGEGRDTPGCRRTAADAAGGGKHWRWVDAAGWMLTENGRQPWIVQGLQLVRDAVSPSNSVTTIVISLSVFVLLYATLGVVDFLLMTHFARKELAPEPDPAPADDAPPVLHFTY